MNEKYAVAFSQPNRSKQIVKGRARNAFAGDAVYLMTQQNEDVTGETWGAGTEYTPLYAGANNLHNRMEQVITIGGKKVTFSA